MSMSLTTASRTTTHLSMSFPHVEITNTFVRHAFTIGLGSIEVVLGVLQVVRGFEQSNPIAVLRGLKAILRGAWAIYTVIAAHEGSWEDVSRLAFSVSLLLVSPYGKVDDLFKRFVEQHQKKRV